MGAEVPGDESTGTARSHKTTSSSHGTTTGQEHDNRVLGGYKATLKNPNVSEEAKEHAKEVLEESGESV